MNAVVAAAAVSATMASTNWCIQASKINLIKY